MTLYFEICMASEDIQVRMVLLGEIVVEYGSRNL